MHSLENLEKARDMLAAEKDVESVIMMSRINQLLVKMLLKSHQRLAVPFFHRYVLKAKQKNSDGGQAERREKPSIFTYNDQMITADALWDSLDLENDKIDRRILYEITERRMDGFRDDLSDSDTEVNLTTTGDNPETDERETYSLNQVGGEPDTEATLLGQQ